MTDSPGLVPNNKYQQIAMVEAHALPELPFSVNSIPHIPMIQLIEWMNIRRRLSTTGEHQGIQWREGAAMLWRVS